MMEIFDEMLDEMLNSFNRFIRLFVRHVINTKFLGMCRRPLKASQSVSLRRHYQMMDMFGEMLLDEMLDAFVRFIQHFIRLFIHTTFLGIRIKLLKASQSVSLHRHYHMIEMFGEMLDEMLDAFDQGLT